jgi:hypothetical protein
MVHHLAYCRSNDRPGTPPYCRSNTNLAKVQYHRALFHAPSLVKHK